MKPKRKIIECVPNFSEGRDPEKIERIVEPFRGKEGVRLLDYQKDHDHNRLVVSVIGSPEALKTAVVESTGVAMDVIDMRSHEGQHPRMGAVDVVPFIPVQNVTLKETVDLSKEVAKTVSETYGIPVFLYEKSATRPERENLATIRRGQFEGMAEKIKHPDWTPDYGPAKIHPSAGVVAIGARMPLVAFNVNLNTDNLDVAKDISKRIRHINGGLRYCKAMGVDLKERKMVQVSMNMTDYTQTALYRVFELIRIEARRYGVSIAGSEIVGLVPMEALIDTAVFYMGIEGFSMRQVLEARLLEE